MAWKDFLHYYRGSRLAIILMLILILLLLLLNSLYRYGRKPEMVIMQNEALIRDFDSFRQNLSERVPPPRELSVGDVGSVGNASVATEPDRGESVIHESESVRSLSRYPRTEKLTAGQTIPINQADTTQWKTIPGIGSSYASRIVKYRELLGGYIRKEQLLEVYGMDNALYERIVPFVEMDVGVHRLNVNEMEFRDLLRHPYLNYKQVQAIVNLLRRKGDLVSIDELRMLDEFTSDDIDRLDPYLAF